MSESFVLFFKHFSFYDIIVFLSTLYRIDSQDVFLNQARTFQNETNIFDGEETWLGGSFKKPGKEKQGGRKDNKEGQKKRDKT